MPDRPYEFVQVDVFTRTAFAGNPLAIFPDGRGLTDQEMQMLAREMNLSETTFILPRPAETEAREGKRVRIFTTTEELPFAGHPTLGTALSIYSTAPAAVGRIILDLNVGKIPVDLSPETPDAGRGRVDGKVFGEMRQRDPEFGAIIPREELAQALGLGPEDIASAWPAQVVSTGLPFAIVPIRDRPTLANLKPDVNRVATVLERAGGRFCYFVSPQIDRWADPEVWARMFFYGGEDPATGSAAGCAASWLARHGLVESEAKVLIHQGVEAGRPSEIFVRAKREGETITDVRVGGHAVEVLQGTVRL